MTRKEDIQYAGKIGVDAVGFILYERSRRFVSVEKAKQLMQSTPPFMNTIGVFVDPDVHHVNNAMRHLPLHYLQFHGKETASFCEQFYKPYLKAISAKNADYIKEQMKEHKNACAFLLDTSSELHGGTGIPFDWTLIPEQSPKPLILAGGLNKENINAARELKSIYALDVCSGVEETPGIKDPNKMVEFVNALRRTNEQ